MPSSDAMHFFFNFADVVDDALASGSDPLSLATDPELLAAWTRMAPDETWKLVLERLFDGRHVRLPEHWEGEGLDLARELHEDAGLMEYFGDWEPAVAMPPQEVQLAMLVFYTTAVRLRPSVSRGAAGAK
ncbi:hypothetical protein ABZ281_02750 [Streptomyces sp. NPDC006265]|uniref:hypothetical protein n=1 Tax=Streptomyces sp. NPDC006265 TaxID=3156740 RepID=UPI0033AA0FD4